MAPVRRHYTGGLAQGHARDGSWSVRRKPATMARSAISARWAPSTHLPGDLVDFGKALGREFPIGSRSVLLHLLRLGRAGDNAGDWVLSQQPGEGEFEQRVAALRDEARQAFDRVPFFVSQEFFEMADAL